MVLTKQMLKKNGLQSIEQNIPKSKALWEVARMLLMPHVVLYIFLLQFLLKKLANIIQWMYGRIALNILFTLGDLYFIFLDKLNSLVYLLFSNLTTGASRVPLCFFYLQNINLHKV